MKSRHGFTLVEVLIALALVGIVSLLLLEGIRFAALGLGRVSDQAGRLEARRGIEELLRRDLGTVFTASLPPAMPALIGGPQSMRFLTLAEDGGAGLYRVDLAIAARGGERALVLTRRRLGATGALDTEREVLAPRLKFLRIAYFGRATQDAKPQWQQSWGDSRFPPLMVRIALDTGDGLARPPLVVRLWAAQ